MNEELFKAKPNVIVLLGGPGSGKGTQGDRIQEDYGFIHLSMGDLMRNKKDDPEVINYYVEVASSKKPTLTHEFSLMLLENEMRNLGWAENKFVIDGFHRKFDIYDEQFMDKVNIISVIVLAPSSIDILEQRIKKRFHDNESKETFRKEDLLIMDKRLKIYQTETQEVIQYFRNLIGKSVYEINCDDSIDQVYDEIKKLYISFNI